MRMPNANELAQRDYIKSIHQSLLDGQHKFSQRSYFEWQSELTAEDRQILINWLIVVQVEFRLLPETIQATVNLIDRFLHKKQV